MGVVHHWGGFTTPYSEYRDEVEQLRTWIEKRRKWINENLDKLDLAQNEFVNGWWLGKNYVWSYPYRAKWHKNSHGWWYGDESGWYAKNTSYVIDGVKYTFDAKGYLVE